MNENPTTGDTDAEAVDWTDPKVQYVFVEAMWPILAVHAYQSFLLWGRGAELLEGGLDGPKFPAPYVPLAKIPGMGRWSWLLRRNVREYDPELAIIVGLRLRDGKKPVALQVYRLHAEDPEETPPKLLEKWRLEQGIS